MRQKKDPAPKKTTQRTTKENTFKLYKKDKKKAKNYSLKK